GNRSSPIKNGRARSSSVGLFRQGATIIAIRTEMFYPVFLNLKNKRIVVIGGGAVAERKVESLLGTGASIVLISPDVTRRLDSLAKKNRILLQRRAYARGDCAGAALVFSATDDAEVSSAVFDEATQSGALV